MIATPPEIRRDAAVSAANAGTIRAADWTERVVLLAFYGWLIVRIVDVYRATGNAVSLVILASEGLVVVFVLTRRAARTVSLRPADWGLTAVATLAPLWVEAVGGASLVPAVVAASLMALGIGVQISAKLVLGRNFGCIPAQRRVATRGPYRYVRHPIYAGYLLSHVGFLLVNASVWNLGVYLCCYAAQIPRLRAEERLLSQDAGYRDYLHRVRYRLIPGCF